MPKLKMSKVVTTMSAPVRCAKCSNEVKEGYIYSTRRICWSESSDSIFIDFGNEKLTDNPGVKIDKIPAYRCNTCREVTFKYY